MTELVGKNVLVTAAAQGIGRAAAEACLSAGASVTATDLNTAALSHLGELGAAIERLDGAESGPSPRQSSMAGSGPTADRPLLGG
jgi:2-keto-3-deoxy-L-fuconate dehydrogenase